MQDSGLRVEGSEGCRVRGLGFPKSTDPSRELTANLAAFFEARSWWEGLGPLVLKR